MKRRVFVMIIMLVFGAGCSRQPTEPQWSEQIQIHDNVELLKKDQHSNINYVSLQRDSIILNNVDTNSIADKILISSWKEGFAVKVLDVQPFQEAYLLTTRPASFTEIFKFAEVDTTFKVGPEQIFEAKPLRKGMQIRPSGEDLFEIQLLDVVLYDLDGNLSTTFDQIRASGSYAFRIDSLHFSFKIIDSELDQLRFTAGIGLTGTLELYHQIEIFNFSNQIDLVEFNLNPIMLSVGPIPVIITPVIRFVVGLDANFRTKMSTSFMREDFFLSGVELKNGIWKPIAKSQTDFGYVPFTLSANGFIKAYAGPQVEMLLYGIVGPYMLIDPYFELNVDLFSRPWWSLFGGLETGVGIFMRVFDHTLADVFFPKVIDFRERIAAARDEPPDTPADSGLIAYYPFNGNTNDASGNGYHGILKGAKVTSDRFGKANSAYYFDGKSYIITAENDALDQLQHGSVSMWIKPLQYPAKDQGVLLCYSTDASVNSIYNLALRANGSLELIYKYQGALTPQLITNDRLELNRWYHIVFVSDGKGRNRIFINSKEASTQFIANGASANGSEWFADLPHVNRFPHFIVIGASKRGGQGAYTFFNGGIDDIRVYNYPLSTSEIQQLYQKDNL